MEPKIKYARKPKKTTGIWYLAEREAGNGQGRHAPLHLGLDENRLPCRRVHDARQNQIMELGEQGKEVGLRSRYETGNLVRSARRDVPGDADELSHNFFWQPVGD